MTSLWSCDANIDDILAELSLEEKVSLLAATDWWRTPSILRNGKIFVPQIKTTDGPNGARGESYVNGVKSNCYPCGACVGASFDTKLAYDVAKHIAQEARAKAADVLLAPTVNVVRSPLGGRNYETFSEDPWVLGHMGAAYVNGCQSEKIGATVKHFVANDVEKRRRYLSAEIDERTLREIYLLPFQLIIKDSAPWCLMTSYNKVNNTYCAQSHRLLQTILRSEWKFQGLVMSDWVATYDTISAMKAGQDLEMPGPTKFRGPKLLDAIKDGHVTEDTVNTSAKRVLELIKTCGAFEDPERVEPPEESLVDEERFEFIARVGAECAVVLKNEGGLLPVDKKKKLAVIGHHAMYPAVGGGGSARVFSVRTVSPVEGLKAAGYDVVYEPGVPVYNALPFPDTEVLSPPNTTIATPIGNTDKQDNKPVKLSWYNSSHPGDTTHHVRTEYLETSQYMIKERWPSNLSQTYCTRMTFSLTPKTSGPHTLSVLTTGRAVLYIDDEKIFVYPQLRELEPESMYFFAPKIERKFVFAMTAGRRYSIRLEAWNTDSEVLRRVRNGTVMQGAGFRFLEHVDEDARIAAAVQAARDADVALVFTGTGQEFESEGFDRETMDLTRGQCKLVHAVAEAAPGKTVLVNYSGAPVTLTDIEPKVSAVLQCWFPGQEAGHALAKAVSGHVEPSGRLPVSWPKRVEDNPSFGNFPTGDDDVIRYEEGVGVGYRWYDRQDTPEPLWEFGFGMGYSVFEVAEGRVEGSGRLEGRDGCVNVRCRVRNVGKRKGKAVVQFYVAPPKSTAVERPLKELKGFVKVEVSVGESEEVGVKLDKYAVSYYDAEKECWRVDKGKYEVLVAFSAKDIKQRLTFEVEEGFEWTGI